MEEIIKEGVLKLFDIEDQDINIKSRLLGGMSNFTYIVDVDSKRYTYRIPGKNAEKFVDRKEEIANVSRVNHLGLNNDTLVLDMETGHKIASYVEGKPLFELGIEDYLERAGVLLRKLHNSKVKAYQEYKPLGRLGKYEKLITDLGHIHKGEYKTLKEKFLFYFDFLDSTKKVFCHNDSQPSNFVIGKKDYLLDWEFAGNNDPLYDIACFGNIDFLHALSFLPVYLGREPKKDELKRVYLWRIFQCLQWYNVALYKDGIGLSEELKIDFNFVAKQYLIKIEGLFEGLEKIIQDKKHKI